MMRSNRRPREVVPIEIPTGRITAITPSPRVPGRFDLIVDGEPVARLSIDAIERLRIQPGVEIDAMFGAKIAVEAEISRTYDRAMMMLAARGRASGELRRLLIQKGEAPQTTDAAIERLRAAGFLDDDAFARQFTRYRAVTIGISRRRIGLELGRRGVDRQTAAAAIADTFAEERIDERSAIEAAAEKKLRTLSRVDLPTKRRRLYGFLARRGYDSDAILPIVRRLTEEQSGS